MTHPDIMPRLSTNFGNSTERAAWLGTVDKQMAGFWTDLAIAMVSDAILNFLYHGNCPIQPINCYET